MDEIKLDISITLPEHIIRDMKLSEDTVFESYFDAKSGKIRLRALADEDVGNDVLDGADAFACDGCVYIRCSGEGCKYC